MGYGPPKISLFVTPCHFLLAQKVTKKGTLPNAAPRRPTRPSLGKEASALFYLAGAAHFAL